MFQRKRERQFSLNLYYELHCAGVKAPLPSRVSAFSILLFMAMYYFLGDKGYCDREKGHLLSGKEILTCFCLFVCQLFYFQGESRVCSLVGNTNNKTHEEKQTIK